MLMLHRHEIPYDLLVMRPDFDRSPSSRFKRHALHNLRDNGFTPVIGFEDDIRNVEMLRSEGIKVTLDVVDGLGHAYPDDFIDRTRPVLARLLA